MLPAFWTAWKGAGIAGKAISIGLPIVVVIGAFYIGQWKGDNKGYDRCQQEHAQLALKHASEVVKHTAEQAKLPSRVLESFIKERDEASQIVKTLEKKNQRYEQERRVLMAKIEQRNVERQETPHEPTCENPDPLDDEFVARWDDIARMFLESLEEDGSANTVSSTDRDTESVPGVRSPDVQTATLLRARTAELDEYKRAVDHYNGLREFAKGVYIFQKAWHESQQEIK